MNMRSDTMASKASRPLIVLLLVTAAFYLLLLPRYTIGYCNDDAFYILAAKSLLQGHYVLLQRPGHPALNDPLPGYPLVLAPFVKCVEPHWSFLKLTSIIFTLASCLLTWILSESWFSKGERLWLTGLFAWNPTTVNYSGNVISEPAFLAMSLAVFCGVWRILKNKSRWDSLWVGVLLGWAVLVRPQGIVLMPAVALGLGYAKRWRVLSVVLGISSVIWSGVLLRNYLTTQTATGYLGHWTTALPVISGNYNVLFGNVQEVLRTLIVDDVFALRVSPAMIPLQGILTLLGMFGLGVGVFALLRRTPRAVQALTTSVFLYVFFYLLVHAIWTAVTPRYFLPLLPFVLGALIAGVLFIETKMPAMRRLRPVLLAVVVLGYGYQDLFAIREVRFPPAQNKIPYATLSWIERETLPSDDFLAFRAPVVHLYAHRSALSFLGVKNREEFRYRLLKMGITHVLYEPMRGLFVQMGRFKNPEQIWEQSRGWMGSWPDAFKPVYRNNQESTLVYLVRPDPKYRVAYEQTEGALRDFEVSAWNEGMKKLDQALRLYPNFPAALNIYGTAYLLSGGNLNQAREKFERALQLRPDYPIALLNLGRVYRQMGRLDAARAAFAHCREVLDRSSEDAYLLPALVQAQQGLSR
jgi:4-amino-4-deoxy-L-arabinose transferase-like glycosyltransferase